MGKGTFSQVETSGISVIFSTYYKSNRTMKLVFITQHKDHLGHFADGNFDQQLWINNRESV